MTLEWHQECQAEPGTFKDLQASQVIASFMLITCRMQQPGNKGHAGLTVAGEVRLQNFKQHLRHHPDNAWRHVSCGLTMGTRTTMAGETRLQRFRTWVMILGSLALLPMYTLVSKATSLLTLLQRSSNSSGQKCAK